MQKIMSIVVNLEDGSTVPVSLEEIIAQMDARKPK
jgi:hypothetical protein